MRLRVLTLSAAVLLGATAAPASAAELTISMSGRSFSPARTTVVSGDVVRWRNTDAVGHNVTGAQFASGLLSPRAAFSRRMESPGSYSYVCTLHTFMTGQVDVVGALLETPAGDVLGGAPVTLRGRVPAGTPTVSIERLAATGATHVATATPAADGAFETTIPATETARYRALTSSGASPEVEVRVVSGYGVKLRVARGEHHDRLKVQVRPEPAPGLTAVLELYSRERFSWRRAGHRRLDAGGRATFALSPGLRRRARVLVIDPSGGRLAESASIRLWRAGGVRPPQARGERPAPSGGHHSHH